MVADMRERFQGDWNFNAKFLDHLNDILVRMGVFRQYHQPLMWRDAAKELYSLTKGLMKMNKKIKNGMIQNLDKLMEDIDQTLDISGLDPGMRNTQEGRLYIDNHIQEAEVLLDKFTTDMVTAIHTARLLLPIEDTRKGLKELEREYGIQGSGEDPEEDGVNLDL